MSFFENRLAMSCKQLGEASAELLEWIDDNADVVGCERISLLREFYRAGQSAQRLSVAVNSMSSIAALDQSGHELGLAGPPRTDHGDRTHRIYGD